MKLTQWLLIFIGLVAVTAVAIEVANRASPSGVPSAAPTTAAPAVPPATTPPSVEVYDPVAAGEELPDGYRPLLDRDQIRPVYEPVFTSPNQVDWPPDSLVIGVANADIAKAYPVTHLNSRELVIDTLGDVPILVSW